MRRFLPVLALALFAASAWAQAPAGLPKKGAPMKPPLPDPKPVSEREAKLPPKPVLKDGLRGFEPMDLFRIRRVAGPKLSPDGSMVAFQVTDTDFEKNKRYTHLWLAPVDAAKGAPKALTAGEWNDSEPRWTPDGKAIVFVSTRGGQAELWKVSPDGGEPVQLTKHPADVSGPVLSPDGKWIAFTADTETPCDGKPCSPNKAFVKAKGGEKATGKVIDSLLYRHWDSWRDGIRTHVFVVPAAGGEAKDMTPGDFDSPPVQVGDENDYVFSPDSKWLLWHRNTDPVEAISTNVDIFLSPLDGRAKPENITEGNKARDLTARFSPDGKRIAYRAMARPGFEADRFGLFVYQIETGVRRDLTPKLDLSVQRFEWFPDGKRIVFATHERGRRPLKVIDLETGLVDTLLDGGDHADFDLSADGKRIAWAGSSFDRPAEIFVADLADRKIARVTALNDPVLAGVRMLRPDEVSWVASDATTVSGWLFHPADYVVGRARPMLVWVHGGPEGAWEDEFHYRWNPQPFVAAGYVVFMPNIRGSYGWGQKFTDGVAGSWGSTPFEDLMKGIDWVLRQGGVDADRVGAMGGSYGGYMVDYMMGRTDRFAALMTHAGIFNLPASWGTTEELWFPEWEFGKVPWENPTGYAKYSPHLLAKNFKTPTLVSHGELDYRVSVANAFELFSVLQRKGIPSKLLYFADEGHFILKPQNSKLWYETALDWFHGWLKPEVEGFLNPSRPPKGRDAERPVVNRQSR